MSVCRSNFTLVFFKAAFYANNGDERNLSGSSSYISRHIFQKLLNKTVNLEHRYRDNHLKPLFQDLYKLFLYVYNLHQYIFHLQMAIKIFFFR